MNRLIGTCIAALCAILPASAQLVPAIYPGSLHLRINNGDSSYMRITKFGLSYEDENVKIAFFEEEDAFRYMLYPKQALEIEDCYVSGSLHPELYGDVFCNGFQSWSESREYAQDEKIKPIAGILKPYGKYSGDYTYYNYADQKGVLHSWTYSYVKRNKNQIELIASLDEDPGFTLIRYFHPHHSFRIQRDCSGKTIKDSAYTLLHIYHAVGYEDSLFTNWASLYHPQEEWESKGTTTGWTSWYNYYHNIREDIILHNLHNYDSLKIDIFQVDDGYQQSVGNWTVSNKKFPHGMKSIADSIHAQGFKAGLWIAPFICEKNAPIVKQHPEWILKDEKGKFVKAGYNPGWSGWYYALDIYNPGFREYLEGQIDTLIHVQGFDMIKADFLFAACIQYRNGKTRGEIMADAMTWLREMTEDKLLLGCGVPLASAFKRVDYCRIGNDIHPKWDFGILKNFHAHERPSTVLSLTNTIYRHQLNGRFFINDPDVFILRKQKNKLTPDQRYTNFLTNQLFGGLLFTSDDISRYDQPTMQVYKKHLEKMTISIQSVSVNHQPFSVTVQHTNNGCAMLSMLNLDKKNAVFKFPEGVLNLYSADGRDMNESISNGMLLQLSGIELEKYRSYTAYPQMFEDLGVPQWPCVIRIFPPLE